MNLTKNKKRKKLIIDMIMEIAKIQSKVPDYAGEKLNYILKGFLKETLDFEKAIKYININLEFSKDEPQKIFWITILNIIKKYFEESKNIK